MPKMTKKLNMRKEKKKIIACFSILLFCLFIFTSPISVLAHEGKPHDFAELLKTWSFDPLIIISLILSAWIYLRGVFNLWRSSGFGHGINGWETAAFAGGWISLFIALVSPLHPWGEVLFSAHMTQHEILMLVSAPLFVLSRPFLATLWAMPKSWRIKTNGLVKIKIVEKIWNFLTNSFAAWLIHALALWIWHIPFLFQATLKSDLVHTFQHASFFLSALLFWSAILASPRGALSYGTGVLYLFTTSVHSGLLGVFLTLTSKVWYPVYEESTRSWGLTPHEDQQIGGLIMWIPAGVVYIFAGLLMFAGWLRESEKRVLLKERKMLETL
jgi:cytochrome c oxidase assembly factor CtaG